MPKIEDLTENTTPAAGDILPMVDDPAGTPVTKKVTIANLLALTGNVSVQVLSTPGADTYTPPADLRFALVVCVGAGGASASITGTDQVSSGGGGGATAIALWTAAEIGAGQDYVVPDAAAAGNPGDDASFGDSQETLAKGGAAGLASATSTTVGVGARGGQGGRAGFSAGDLTMDGDAGGPGIIFSTSDSMGGNGGSSFFGGGGRGAKPGSTSNESGEIGGFYGGGAGGGATNNGVDVTGAIGGQGVIFVLEFLGA